ncbi:MAG TPA: protease inhibitor I9 family protein [Longimicrobium sp.]|nr:protease inhibitor I9 family protein [Longimicrobium sp.]
MTGPAPLHGRADAAAPGYIVVFQDGTVPDPLVDELAAAHGFTPKHVFRNALLGFAAEFSADALDAVRRHPAVKYVEHEAQVRMM